MASLSRLRANFPDLAPLPPVAPLALRAYTLTNALGAGRQATLTGLRTARGGLRPCDFPGVDFPNWIGRVEGLEKLSWPSELAEFDCRNHRLAWQALIQDCFIEAVTRAARRHGPARVAVIIGTSTSGILETEAAYRQRDPISGRLPRDFRYRTVQNTFAPADFVRFALKLAGPTLSISRPARPAPRYSPAPRACSPPAGATRRWWAASTASA
ncbi:MAG: hypothetical protein ACKN9W_10820 [Methylococcus sp.]